MSNNTNGKMKTKCYYTDYVNHMIRFYLSTPDGINLMQREYTNASITNWSAVQMVFHRLDPIEADLIRKVFDCGHYLPKAVDDYCKKNGINPDEGRDDIWKVLTRVNAKIARVRGLI